ncbi:MAG: BamA/TamA family outer membrane protein [Gemmatimonadales bacterium]
MILLSVIDRVPSLVSLMLLVVPLPLAAQEVERCEAGQIASIDIVRRPVFDSSSNGTLSKLYTAANWLHVETREDVVRRELLFQTGDCFDPLLLSESERFLRNFRFIESARVRAHRRPDGDVDVVVETHDDWSLRLEPRFNLGGGFAISGIGITERNIAGRGSTIEILYFDRSGPDDLGLSYFDPQLLGTRTNLVLSGIRTEPGWTVDFSLAYPFLGLVGRRSAFQQTFYSERRFRYVATDSDEGDTPEYLQPLTHKLFEFGGAFRRATGRRGISVKQATLGLTVSYEDLRYGQGFYRDSLAAAQLGLLRGSEDAQLSTQLSPRKTLRTNLLLGYRGLRYVQRSGVSTLRGLEDLAIGGTSNIVVGLAEKALGADDSHVLLGVDLYGGARVVGDWFSLLRIDGEALRDFDTDRWRDVFAAVEWTNLWIINSRSVAEVTARFRSGWETTVPFQLTLGGPWGLAGYAPDRYPGGARLAVRAENRYRLTTVGRLLDLGSTVFLDVGRMWANDAAFGVNSGLRASVGLGVRLASPTGSRTTYRLQTAFPIEAGVSARDIVFTLQIDRLFGLESGPTDAQLDRSRDLAVRYGGYHLR